MHVRTSASTRAAGTPLSQAWRMQCVCSAYTVCMQWCACSAHAVHVPCTCSAHAVHMQCTCSAHAAMPGRPRSRAARCTAARRAAGRVAGQRSRRRWQAWRGMARESVGPGAGAGAGAGVGVEHAVAHYAPVCQRTHILALPAGGIGQEDQRGALLGGAYRALLRRLLRGLVRLEWTGGARRRLDRHLLRGEVPERHPEGGRALLPESGAAGKEASAEPRGGGEHARTPSRRNLGSDGEALPDSAEEEG
eukprot:scaffold79755_cov67-Phaeocystis_antarctica.AAC.2